MTLPLQIPEPNACSSALSVPVGREPVTSPNALLVIPVGRKSLGKTLAPERLSFGIHNRKQGTVQARRLRPAIPRQHSDGNVGHNTDGNYRGYYRQPSAGVY